MSVFGAQFGFATESVWGTVVTPDHFLPLLSESVEYNPTWGNSNAIFAGQFGMPVSRSKVVRFEAGGDISVELAYSKLGPILKQGFGSSATPTNITGTAYKQVHQIGSTDGKSLSLQLGRNEVSTGTIKPFTYPGSKITQLALAVSDSDTGAAALTLSVNSKTESTSTGLAAASYASGANAPAFGFADVSAVKLGGTPSTTSGVISVASGVQATSLLHGLTAAIALPTATDRFNLGNQGAKNEQVNNAQPSISGTFSGEFSSQSEIYDVWKAQTTTALQITFLGPQIAATGSFYTFDLILPAVKITKAPPHINNYDPTPMSVEWTAFRDDVNGNNMAQITYINADSTL